MRGLLILLAFLALWFVVNKYLLPRLGVPT